ncbi:hypothetical protein BJ138DRAFT_1145256 [Hygrophoropsis aurantiaca]|uniref:Uncharacterized protein n=1 Tax=Hygrophoropsis aurantiaca TaxID=72124 RepID=A0ACB8AKU0_9AGAM|nr:hypothetical protein BJ138DRAFT_1145256 [Hygrophoropsis aurantiaca]
MNPTSSSAILRLLAPGLFGFTISLAMYGIALGQYIFYQRAFPNDPKVTKYFVSFLILLDTLHVYGSSAFEWSIFVPCRHNGSIACFTSLPWQSIMALFITFLVPFSVQSFYARRLWTISGNNAILTGTVYLLSAVQLVLGSVLVVFGSLHVSITFSTPFMLSALICAVATDIIISGCVYFYLRPGRFGIKRTETRLRHLTIVSINMGFLTCAVGLMATVFVSKPELGYDVSAAGMIIVKCHINSVLAVLNARKPSRPGKQPDPLSTIQLPSDLSMQLADMSTGSQNRVPNT